MFAQRRSSFPARAMCLTVSTAGVGIAAAPPLIADWVPIAINAFIRLLLRPFLSRFMGSSLSACYEDWPCNFQAFMERSERASASLNPQREAAALATRPLSGQSIRHPARPLEAPSRSLTQQAIRGGGDSPGQLLFDMTSFGPVHPAISRATSFAPSEKIL